MPKNDMKKIKKDDLYRIYVVERNTLKQTASYFGYKSTTTISNMLKYYEIAVRNIRECQFPIELDAEIVDNLYNNKNHTMQEIAKYFKCGDETIRRFMIKAGISRKSKTHKMAGWNKGLTKKTDNRILNYSKKLSIIKLNGRQPAPKKYGTGWDSKRKERLLYDNYTCQSCGSDKLLHVHHWIPYRFCYDNSLENLVTLCRNCHTDMHKTYVMEGFIEEMENEYYG